MKFQFSLAFLLVSLFGYSQVEELNLLSTWGDSTLVGSSTYDNVYNEIWGLAIEGKEYAVLGSSFGTHIIDVTDPNNSQELHRIPGKWQGRQIIHRDYHDYGCYLYAVCDEGASSLQIIDLSNLPESAPVVYDEDLLIQTSHNIFIDSSSARLYALAMNGVDVGYSALAIFDISDPINPKYLTKHNTFGNIRAGHVHDAYIRNDTAYLNCGNRGFAMVDFSDPMDPITINTLQPSEYPSAGYNHSCWISDDGSTVYMADETWGSDIKVLDVRDPLNIDIATVINAGSTDPNSIPHNQVVACDYLYVSYYYDGIQVYDISDPRNPVRTHHYATSKKPHRRNYEGAWGVYPLLPSGNILVADMQEGLFVFEALNSSCNEVLSCPLLVNTNDYAEERIEIQPNPVFSSFTWQVEEDGLAHILTVDGKILASKRVTVGQDTWKVDFIPRGLYMLKHGDAYQKWMKQ